MKKKEVYKMSAAEKQEHFKGWLYCHGYDYGFAKGDFSDECEISEEMIDMVFEDSNGYEPIQRIVERLTDAGFSQNEKTQLLALWHKWRKEKEQNEKSNKMPQPYNRMSKGEASKYLEYLKYMPELHHSIPGADKFDITESEVVKWLIGQPAILQYLFIRAKNSGYIVYDKETGTWKGINFTTGKEDAEKVGWQEGVF